MWIKTEDSDLINSDNIINIYGMGSPLPNKICAKLINGDFVTIRKFNTASDVYKGINRVFDVLALECRTLDCSGLKEESE